MKDISHRRVLSISLSVALFNALCVKTFSCHACSGNKLQINGCWKKKLGQALRGKKYVHAGGRDGDAHLNSKLASGRTFTQLRHRSLSLSPLPCSWRRAQKANSISAHTRAFCTSGPFVNAKSARCKYRARPSVGRASPPRGDVERREGRARLLTLNGPGQGEKKLRTCACVCGVERRDNIPIAVQ